MSVPGDQRDRVVAWIVDPWRVLVAWEVAASTRVRTLRRLGARARNARPALRLAARAAGAPVELAPDAASHLLEASPDGPWAVEVGFQLDDGGFVVVARSPVAGGDPVLDESPAVTWVAAGQPTVAIGHPWSGRRVPSESGPPCDRPGASDAIRR